MAILSTMILVIALAAVGVLLLVYGFLVKPKRKSRRYFN